MTHKWTLAFGLGLACLAGAGRADDWPQFRGPGGAGRSEETKAPDRWGPDKNIAWKVKVPGYGWSSPIVWGDKVFVTTAVSDKQRKPAGGYGGGPGGRGGPGGFRPPQPGQILPPFLQNMLELSDDQKKDLDKLQKEVDRKLGKLLTDEQKKQLKEAPGGFGRGGFGRGGRGGPGGFDGFRPPQPGQILPPFQQERLKLSDEQKKDLGKLQKEVDGKLAKLLTEKQNKQLKDMREGFGRGGFGRGGRGGFGRGGFGGGRPPDEVYRWQIYCLDRNSGKVLWKVTAREGKPRIPTQPSNTYASETPVTDGERVYAYFGMHGVYCYDVNGKFQWKVDLGSYPTALGFGTGGSPVLEGGRLFVQCDNEKQSFLVALNAKTGKELWRTKRTERTTYSTPLVWKNKVRTEVVCVGTPKTRSYDPATGKQLWELGGMTGQPKASATAGPDLLYVGTGGGPGGFGGAGGRGGPGGEFSGARPLVAVKAGASGDITLKDGEESNDGIAWYLPNAGPATPTPLLYEGLLYVLDDRNGLVSCYDAKSGKQVYKKRLPGARGFTSSPWAYGGKVFCLDDAGTTHVLKAGREFKVLGKNTIPEMCWSTPAVAGDALVLRTVDHLYCIKGKGGEK
jgi:outer membrane protein assembly factor BamB